MSRFIGVHAPSKLSIYWPLPYKHTTHHYRARYLYISVTQATLSIDQPGPKLTSILGRTPLTPFLILPGVAEFGLGGVGVEKFLRRAR